MLRHTLLGPIITSHNAGFKCYVKQCWVQLLRHTLLGPNATSHTAWSNYYVTQCWVQMLRHTLLSPIITSHTVQFKCYVTHCSLQSSITFTILYICEELNINHRPESCCYVRALPLAEFECRGRRRSLGSMAWYRPCVGTSARRRPHPRGSSSRW